MIRAVAAFLFWFALVGVASAQNCSSYPPTFTYPNPLTNGTNANADQVMADFNAVRNCVMTLPAPPTSALSDVDRQNILLESIYQAKLFGGYRRQINRFSDGYKASDGINAASSFNYSVNTTNGKVSPTSSAGSYTAQITASFTTDSPSGNSGYTTRQLLPAGSGGVTGGYVRITLTAPTGNSFSTDSVYIGHAGTAPNFDGSQVPVTFSGGSSSVTVSPGSTVVSDEIAYAYDNTKALIIAIHHTSQFVRYVSGLASTYNGYQKASVNEAATTSVSGYSSSSGLALAVSKVESAPATPSNMTLVSTSQTADASVSNGRVLLEYDNSANPTLNTDLTAEVTCNGGANWASAALSTVSSNGQTGHKIAETSDTACTSGTSFAARIKTSNSKNVPIYGASLTVH